jgi:toxin CptA
LAVALVLSFVAGFALQRGGICAVRAVRDVVEQGRWARFVSFIECAAWALVILVLAQSAGAMVKARWPDHQALPLAFAGGAVFGLGALLNGACAFGSAGRLAAGDLSFLALLPGFVFGAFIATRLELAASLSALAAWRATPAAESVLGATLVMFAMWRLFTAWRSVGAGKHVGHSLADPKWRPSLAMAVVAFSNVGLMLIVASWPYTTLLLDIALGRGAEVGLRGLLVFVFLAGAFAGAVSSGRFRWRGGSLAMLAARLGGGTAMGFGAALIPGGNDALVLLGLPLLQPAALSAYAGMIGAIALGFGAQRLGRPKPSAPAQAS